MEGGDLLRRFQRAAVQNPGLKRQHFAPLVADLGPHVSRHIDLQLGARLQVIGPNALTKLSIDQEREFFNQLATKGLPEFREELRRSVEALEQIEKPHSSVRLAFFNSISTDPSSQQSRIDKLDTQWNFFLNQPQLGLFAGAHQLAVPEEFPEGGWVPNDFAPLLRFGALNVLRVEAQEARDGNLKALYDPYSHTDILVIGGDMVTAETWFPELQRALRPKLTIVRSPSDYMFNRYTDFGEVFNIGQKDDYVILEYHADRMSLSLQLYSDKQLLPMHGELSPFNKKQRIQALLQERYGPAVWAELTRRFLRGSSAPLAEKVFADEPKSDAPTQGRVQTAMDAALPLVVEALTYLEERLPESDQRRAMYDRIRAQLPKDNRHDVDLAFEEYLAQWGALHTTK